MYVCVCPLVCLRPTEAARMTQEPPSAPRQIEPQGDGSPSQLTQVHRNAIRRPSQVRRGSCRPPRWGREGGSGKLGQSAVTICSITAVVLPDKAPFEAPYANLTDISAQFVRRPRQRKMESDQSIAMGTAPVCWVRHVTHHDTQKSGFDTN